MTLEKSEILHNDDAIVAIAKPSGLATIPGRAEETSCLEQIAKLLELPWAGTSDPRIRVVHRLDKDTSGVLLFAKNVETQRHLSHQFQNNTIEKEYLALVVGRPETATGIIEAPLAPHPTSRDRMTVSKHGRRAVTEWKLVDQFRGFALLACFPRTGKTHQIRVHLKHIGLPLAIDPLYNPTHGKDPSLFLSSFKRGYRANTDRPERPLISRLTLHAHRLAFVHPNESRMELVAPPPKDFAIATKMLTKYGRA